MSSAPRFAARASRVEFGLAAGAAFLLYATTACRTFFTGSSAAFAGAAASFGVPEPPGYPLYTLVTGIFTHFFPIGSRALAANLASCIFGAASVALTLALARRTGLSRAAAWFATISLAAGRAFWARCGAAGVESFDLALLLAAALAFWNAGERRDRRHDVIAGAVLGLWIGHRTTNLLYLPALLLLARAAGERAYTLARRAPRSRRERLAPFAAAALAWALPLPYLLFRASAHPAFDIGDPHRPRGFFAVVGALPGLAGLDLDSVAHAGPRLAGFLRALPEDAGAAALLALVALWLLARGSRRAERASAAFLLLLVTNVLVTSLADLADPAAWRLPAMLALVMLGARGADALLAGLAGARDSRRLPAGVLLIAAALALVPVNRRADDLAPDRIARSRAEDLLDSVPPGALLLVKSERDTNTLWYLQGIEDRTKDVRVISLAYDDEGYFEWLRARYPREPFPLTSSRDPAAERFLKIVQALEATHPVCFAFDPLELARLAPSPWWEDHTFAPVGLVVQAFPRHAPPDDGALVSSDLEFWRARTSRTSKIRPWSGFESKVIGLEYAFALQRTGEFLVTLERTPEAAELFQAVVRMRPSQWEEDLMKAQGEPAHRSGAPDLEGRAMSALADLSRPPAAETEEHWFRGAADSTGAQLPPTPPVGYPSPGGK